VVNNWQFAVARIVDFLRGIGGKLSFYRFEALVRHGLPPSGDEDAFSTQV